MPMSCSLRKAAQLAAVLLLGLGCMGLFAEEMSPRIAAALASIFKRAQGAEMNTALSYELANLPSAKEKRELLAAFADFEEGAGLYESAAAHYAQAAEVGGADGAQYFGLCLDAARCFMYVNDVQKANALIEKTLANCFDSATLFRARFYAACAQLSREDSDAAIAQLRAYLSIEGFAPFFPQILFILWYAAQDADAGALLVASYPSSAEAAIVRGEASVLPRAFWYLMPTGRKPKSEDTGSPGAATADAGASSGRGISHSVTGRWQQTGFFSSRANAQVQSEELGKAGFRVFIREERRPTGDVFFSVLIPEDDAGSTAIRLREIGFESYLIVD